MYEYPLYISNILHYTNKKMYQIKQMKVEVLIMLIRIN